MGADRPDQGPVHHEISSVRGCRIGHCGYADAGVPHGDTASAFRRMTCLIRQIRNSCDALSLDGAERQREAEESLGSECLILQQKP